MQVEGDHLDGLAQPHVVGEAAAQPELGHLREPADAAALIGAQLGAEPGRLDHVLATAGQGSEPVGQRRQRTLDAGGDGLAADLQGAAGQPRRQRLGGAHPLGTALAQPVEQVPVDGDPLAPDADPWALGLGERGHLL